MLLISGSVPFISHSGIFSIIFVVEKLFLIMTSKTKKNVLWATFVLFIIVVAYGYFLYNKGPLDVRSSSGVIVTSTDLYGSYRSDSINAGKKYIGQILEVSGEVFEVSLNTQQQQVILLKTGIQQGYVNCTLEGPCGDIRPADKISIKGICGGMGQGYPDMGIMGDVYLTRCFISK